ncbi:4-oxalomesaconate hydratase [Novosphingobium sp. AAP83]|uniref:amidohydrolase family protein n=1 Tax=Novosphingobium sp. AAP83 TaxID=1523425 RepID=UPI0006B88621|nr:amidohydrolase family protein [Novosphingobium sp. AAP83]KPF88579.1 4-oxalomesaconate hydratase [Novosphingobium sp. AAP83]
MIIDCHGHFTTVPQRFRDWRSRQVDAANDPANSPDPKEAIISDDEIHQGVGGGQLRLQKERGADLTLFSPIAGLMSHHLGNERTSIEWATVSNNNVKRVCELYPDNFVPVCQLPQSPGAPPANSVPELRRCVEEMGFIGCNLNPDPTGGYWTGKPVTDREWYPLYEAMCELDVPGMIHVAASCNPNFHGTGAHYLNADTSVFMQILQSDLFKDFPTLRLIIPHGGGAVPYHWGRYRGMSLEIAKRPLEGLLENIYFDTCVYHHPGVELLTKVVPTTNVLFGSEMIGAVRGTDPNTGHYFDDTKRYVDACEALDENDRALIFEGNARRVFPRLDAQLKAKGL